MEEGWVLDGTIAQDSAQAAGIWGLREGVSVALKHAGALALSPTCASPWAARKPGQLPLCSQCALLSAMPMWHANLAATLEAACFIYVQVWKRVVPA